MQASADSSGCLRLYKLGKAESDLSRIPVFPRCLGTAVMPGTSDCPTLNGLGSRQEHRQPRMTEVNNLMLAWSSSGLLFAAHKGGSQKRLHPAHITCLQVPAYIPQTACKIQAKLNINSFRQA